MTMPMKSSLIRLRRSPTDIEQNQVRYSPMDIEYNQVRPTQVLPYQVEALANGHRAKPGPTLTSFINCPSSRFWICDPPRPCPCHYSIRFFFFFPFIWLHHEVQFLRACVGELGQTNQADRDRTCDRTCDRTRDRITSQPYQPILSSPTLPDLLICQSYSPRPLCQSCARWPWLAWETPRSRILCLILPPRPLGGRLPFWTVFASHPRSRPRSTCQFHQLSPRQYQDCQNWPEHFWEIWFLKGGVMWRITCWLCDRSYVGHVIGYVAGPGLVYIYKFYFFIKFFLFMW